MVVRQEVFTLKLDTSERNVLLRAVGSFRNHLIASDKSTDRVDEMYLKLVQARKRPVMNRGDDR